MYERVKEEMRDMQRKDEKNPLWRHAEDFHKGEWFHMEVKVIGKCFGKPSKRMITEVVRIGEVEREDAMNGKQEWSYIRLDKVRVG